MEPQGEQADFELRHWDGSDEADLLEGKELDLMDVYAEVEDEKKWDYLREPGIRLIQGTLQTAQQARVFIVGEAPTAVDNGANKPFAGRVGEILEQLLGLAGLDPSQCFMTYAVKYRPRGGKLPGYGEALMGKDSLRAEWKIIDPVLTIAIGAVAHMILSPSQTALAHFRHGEIWTFAGRSDRFITSMLPPALAFKHERYQEQIEGSWETLGKMIDELELRRLL